MPSFDAIVIGAGPNGLACASRLQAGGRRVLLLDEAEAPGGGATARGTLAPLAHLAFQLDPRVEADMDLARHGLGWHTTGLATTAVSATGDHLRIEGGRVSGPDAAAWAALHRQLMSFAGVLAPFRQMTPPRLAKAAGNEVLRLAKLGLSVRALGKQEFRELLRMLLINVHDVLNDELTDPRLKGALAFDATLGSWLGPRSPNSLILLLDRMAGQVAGQRGALGLPRGGMAAVAAAMAASAAASGVTIRQGARVARILTDGETVQGVEVAGEALLAPLVVSAINPATTLLDLIGPRLLDAGLVTRLRHRKSRGAAAKLHLRLRDMPDFRGADLRTRLVIAPSEDAVELAFNPVKYGQTPAAPVLEAVLPAAFDGGAPILSVIAQYAPHAPADPDAARSAMQAAVMAQLEAHAPGLSALVEAAEMLMPYDIQARWGLPGGNWHHGELSVEQMLFLRPLPGLSQYQTPIAGLWLAGAGSHPGGGISGAAGWNAAGQIGKVLR